MKASHVIPATALCLALVPMGAWAEEPQDALEVAAQTVQSNHMPSINPDKPISPEDPSDPVISDSDKVHQTTLNYYINLAGNVLDSEEGASHYAADDFTEALTETKKVDSSFETAVNSNEHHSIINDEYDAVFGANSDDYVNADSYIRDILSSKGVLPTDEAVLAEVKSQIENGATIKDISGETVSSSLVSVDYFQVYWYVLKEGSDEWHVDGILKKLEQPTVQTYTVNYEWENAPEGVELPKTVIYAEGDTCVVDTEYYEDYEVVSPEGKSEGGYWTFSGWNVSGGFEVIADATIRGVWTYHEPESGEPESPTGDDEKQVIYTVDYQWSGDAPEGVELPQSKDYEKGQTCEVAELAKTTVETDDGIWTFKGWDKTGEFEVTEDTTITGTWEFEKKEVAPEPENPETPDVPEPENPDVPENPENPNAPDPDSDSSVVPPVDADDNDGDSDAVAEEEPEVKQLATKSEMNSLPQTGDKEALAFGLGLLSMIAAVGAALVSRFKMKQVGF